MLEFDEFVRIYNDMVGDMGFDLNREKVGFCFVLTRVFILCWVLFVCVCGVCSHGILSASILTRALCVLCRVIGRVHVYDCLTGNAPNRTSSLPTSRGARRQAWRHDQVSRSLSLFFLSVCPQF